MLVIVGPALSESAAGCFHSMAETPQGSSGHATPTPPPTTVRFESGPFPNVPETGSSAHSGERPVPGKQNALPTPTETPKKRRDAAVTPHPF